MNFGFKRIWSSLKDFNLGGLVSKMSISNITGEEPKKSTESISFDQNSKTKEGLSIINTYISYIKNLGLPFVKAEEDKDQIPNLWQDMIIKGPYTYANMRKSFDDVLITCRKNSQTLTRKFSDEVMEIKFETLNYFNNFNSLRLNVHGNMLTPGIINPFFRIGDKNNIGLDIRPNASVIINTGISKRLDGIVDRNTFWTSVNFQKQAVVLDTKIKFIKYPDTNVVNMEVSGILGHNFGNWGILAGFDLAINSLGNFYYQEMCKAVSLGIVSRTSATIFTVNPNDEIIKIESRFKIKDSFEFAARSKINFISQTMRNRDNEVGLKYKHSEDMTYKIKLDFDGNITVGAWLNTSAIKMALLAKTNVQNIGFIENVGITIEI